MLFKGAWPGGIMEMVGGGEQIAQRREYKAG